MRTSRAFLLAGLVLAFVAAGCQGTVTPPVDKPAENDSDGQVRWIAFGQQAGPAPVQAQVSNRVDGVSINLAFPGFHARTVSSTEGTFIQPRIQGCGRSGQVGAPELPFRGFFLQLPHGVTPTLSVEQAETIELGAGFRILPRQPAQIESSDEIPPFTLDEQVYATDSFTPTAPAEIARVGVIRGRRVAFVKVYPLSYNPATGELRAVHSLKLRLHLAGQADLEAERRQARLQTLAFEDQARRLVANYTAPARDAFKVRSAGDQGADYLIVTTDELAACVAPLAQWKVEKGYRVEVVPMSAIGSSASDLKAFVQQAYDTWATAPSYLLLVGDHAQVPSHPVSPDAYGSSFISDSPYSQTDGSDYWPDLVVGRLSVDTPTACQDVVAKVLRYDRDPAPGDWYGHSLVAAYYQDSDGNCQADRWFMETAARVHDFLRDSAGHSLHTALVNGNTCATYNYRSSSYPHRPDHPASVPAHLVDQFVSESGGTNAIHAAFASGVGLVQHRDHGGETGWGDPPFYTSDVAALSNGEMTPVVFSINCLTGAFDHGSDCFAEALQKHASGGAVGVVAASRVSYSGYNDLLTHGLYTSFWPAYDGSHVDTTYPTSRRPAVALDYAKYYMYLYEGDTSETLYEFRLFHWFGDPEMSYRDAAPQILGGLQHAPSLPPGATTFEVSGAPDGALVALSQDGAPLGRTLSASGLATVTIAGPVAVSEPVMLTVTHPSAVPYQTELLTVSSRGTISLDRGLYDCQDVVQVHLADTDLTGQGPISLTLTSDTTPGGAPIDLTESPAGSGVFAGNLSLSDGGDADLQVAHGDALEVTYFDADDGTGSSASVSAAAQVRCLPPTISDLRIEDLGHDAATVCFATDVPTTAVLTWGPGAPPELTVEDANLATEHCLTLSGLNQCTGYVFSLAATDELGHTAFDDNGGAFHSLTTAHSGRVRVWSEPLDADPGWARSGDWAFGAPAGLSDDPAAAHSGQFVFGNDLTTDGAYPDNASDYTLTTATIDLSGASAPVSLGFWRWLNIESDSYDHARVEAFDGSTWQAVWAHSGSTYHTDAWEYVELDISAYAGRADLQIRFTLDTDGSVTYGGWNIDDLQIFATDANASCSNRAPAADAGQDQQVSAGAPVVLDGGASSDPDGDPLSYHWSQTGGPAVNLSDTNAVAPTFSAPQVDLLTTLTFSLMVSDGLADSQPDSVSVQVAPGAIVILPGDLLITEIMPDPTTPEPEDEWFELHNTTDRAIDLTGFQITDEEGTPVRLHTISDLQIPAGGYAVLANEASAELGFAPDYLYGETYIVLANAGDQVSLRDPSGQIIDRVDYAAAGMPSVRTGASLERAADGASWCQSPATAFNAAGDAGTPGAAGGCESQPATIEVTATDTPLSIPDVSSVTSQITIDQAGGGTWVEAEVHISHTYIGDLRVILEHPDGSSEVLHDRTGDGADDLHQTFPVAGFNGKSITGTWKLIVSDHATVDTGSLDSWTLRIEPGPISNQAPVADAGGDQTVIEGDPVALDGTGSYDPDGHALAYAWTQVAGPAVSLSDPGLANPSFVAPQVDQATVLSFDLVVDDGQLVSATDRMDVLVEDSQVGPGDLIISEIMADPRTGSRDPHNEWFEIHNTTGQAIDFEGFGITDEEGTPMRLHIIAQSLIVPAGSTVVLAYSASADLGFTPDYLYGETYIVLANSGDQVVLRDPDGLEMDRVDYSAASFPSVRTGVSLERGQDGTWCRSAADPFNIAGELGTPSELGGCM